MAELDTQLTLEEVARQYGVPPETLIQMSRDGIIRAAKSGSDQEKPAVTVSTVAAAANIVKGEIKPEQYKHLRGKKIRLMEASRQYGVEHSNLIRWAERGYVKVLGQEKLHLALDAAEAAYISAVFRRATEMVGSPIRAGWVLKRIFD